MKNLLLGLALAMSTTLFCAEPLKGIINLDDYITKTKSSKSLSLAAFNEMLKEGNVIVKYFAEWCGPCKSMGKTIHEIAGDFPDVVWIEVNIEKFKNLSSGISSLPTLVFYKNGQEIQREKGSRSAPALRALVKKAYA